jgi:Uri superfamily endonuclease
MRGAYCLIIEIPKEKMISIGSLGPHRYLRGVYAYVGSALSGIEQRVGRHKSQKKRLRWHIDYLLANADILATVAIPGDRKEVECGIIQALQRCEGASIPVAGFGSSDCRCDSHLLYFGDLDPELVMEMIMRRLSMLECMYPRRTARRPNSKTRRE